MNIKLSDNNKYVELIRQSFKKLKSAIFFDKTQLVLRDKLIAYETSPDFESNLNDLALKMLLSWQSKRISNCLIGSRYCKLRFVVE